MLSRLSKLLGWATPVPPAFDPATLAVRLGHEKGSCLMRRQGRCPGRHLCADCPWAEGTARPDSRS
ncbi:hypothetical protein [Pelomicrobium methylotrophicum]|uniref:Uncharacterized protein n=1 Tax=Pelomicrobium methylotrophicum TaxID=2602750 RepID=A0A5C7ESX3_9PROT|nr:hypothetical protein [Pelomicrobium methylotrophicum]TXF10384.1 hypothetical protein FR698_15425 [Pelomicrobium methylotrophicum]